MKDYDWIRYVPDDQRLQIVRDYQGIEEAIEAEKRSHHMRMTELKAKLGQLQFDYKRIRQAAMYKQTAVRNDFMRKRKRKRQQEGVWY